MPIRNGWNAKSAIAACSILTWEGSVWRIHKQKYAATDPGGSRIVSGRYHRGTDQVPDNQARASLYLATQPEICLAEFFRHITPELFPFLNNYRLSEISIRLSAVLDCREPDRMGIDVADLVEDADYELTQSIGKAAYVQGLECLLTPSATGLGDNLILFPRNIRATSQLQTRSSRDPRLRPI